jgi:DNA-binding response OmpR family regulator
MTTTVNILVVGDDEESCTYLAKMLSAKDWQTDIAWIGSKALDLARKNAYDAIVFDYRRPGLDGADVCNRIRRSLPGARIVFMTGTQNIDTVYRAVEAGADRVLAKPVDPAELVRVLEEPTAGTYSGKTNS